MPLNESKGNMYDFVTHTWNTVKGECPHGCTYCYMHRWGKQKPVRFDEKELKTDLGSGNFIFVGSSCDMWADYVPTEWIFDTLRHCWNHKNRYLFQSKNPSRFLIFKWNDNDVRKYKFCTTLESDSFYPSIMMNSPHPMDRSLAMQDLSQFVDTYVTIEPIMDFHQEHFIKMIHRFNPKQVNIGADTGRNNLPEPSKEKILELISELQKFTVVHQKSNLKRLL